jgi:hypothetical protein
MNTIDVARVLAKIATFDNRTVEASTVAVWGEVIGDLQVDDCLAAVAEHFAGSTDYLLPAHVRAVAERLAAERRAHQRALATPPTQPRPVATEEHKAAIIAELRRTLPPGRPQGLRGEHWLAEHPEESRRGRMFQRRIRGGGDDG